MGVYVNGMKMPTSCEECQFNRLDPTGEILLCDLTLFAVSWAEKERPFDCPLIEVPEQKHGKWIEYTEAFGFGGLQEHIVCSECLEVFYLVNNDTEKFNYCPWCGARMDGE